jgi:hypothetical protein
MADMKISNVEAPRLLVIDRLVQEQVLVEVQTVAGF